MEPACWLSGKDKGTLRRMLEFSPGTRTIEPPTPSVAVLAGLGELGRHLPVVLESWSLILRESPLMNRNDLANEIRGAGFALRYADGPVIGQIVRNGKPKNLHSVQRKLKLSDWDIIEMAATCSSCDEKASQFDIGFAEDVADCYQSFARMIWPCIDHEPGCPAKPYISVSGKSQRSFARLKAKFEEMQRVRAEQAAMPPQTRRKKKASRKIPGSGGSNRSEKRVVKKATKKAAKKVAKKKPPRKKGD